MGKLNVDGTEIQVLQIEEDDYISLTDMVRKIDNRSALIEKWLRNKNRLYLGGVLRGNWKKLTTGYIQMPLRLILSRRNLHHSKSLLFTHLKLMLLNMALSGMNAKQWRDKKPDKKAISGIMRV